MFDLLEVEIYCRNLDPKWEGNRNETERGTASFITSHPRLEVSRSSILLLLSGCFGSCSQIPLLLLNQIQQLI